MRPPLPLGFLFRPAQLPRVADDQHVALAGVAEPAFADAGQVGEPEDGGLHLRPEPRLEVGADGAALVLADVRAALALLEVRAGQGRAPVKGRLGEVMGPAPAREEPVAARPAEWAPPRTVSRRPRDRDAVVEHALTGLPDRPALHPRAANLVELVARDLDGQRRAQRGAPRLHAADLHVLPTVGQVEVVAVEELVDRDPLDGEALAPLVAALAEDLMELAPGLCFVLHPRIGRVAPAGLAGKLVLEPPIAGELPTAHA